MIFVKTKVVLKGSKGSKELVALVDTGASTPVIDRSLAEEIGVIFTGRRALVTVSGHKIEGEVAIIKELIIEDEALDYKRVLVNELSEDVKKTLKNIGVSDLLIIELTTIESASLLPDTKNGKLRKFETFLFLRI